MESSGFAGQGYRSGAEIKRITIERKEELESSEAYEDPPPGWNEFQRRFRGEWYTWKGEAVVRERERGRGNLSTRHNRAEDTRGRSLTKFNRAIVLPNSFEEALGIGCRNNSCPRTTCSLVPSGPHRRPCYTGKNPIARGTDRPLLSSSLPVSLFLSFSPSFTQRRNRAAPEISD